MIHTQPIIADTDTDAPHPSAQRAVRHMRLLEDLAEMGMDLARNVRRQASEPGDTPVQGDLGLTFSRISRAVRQTIALEARIDADQLAWAAKLETGRAALRAEESARQIRTNILQVVQAPKIGRAVEQAIEAEFTGDDDVDRLLDDLCERLNDDETYADWEERPVGEIVAAICKDLGLTPDWSRWEGEDWAIEEARTGAVGSPYASDRNDKPPGDDGVKAATKVRPSRRAERRSSG